MGKTAATLPLDFLKSLMTCFRVGILSFIVSPCLEFEKVGSLLELSRALNLRRPLRGLDSMIRGSWASFEKNGGTFTWSARRSSVSTRASWHNEGPEMSFSGRWELPGGKVRPGEEPEEALRREVLEELDLDVNVGPMIASENSQPDERPFQVDVYEATVCSGAPHLQEHSQHRWIN